jgi:hypothetical protein
MNKAKIAKILRRLAVIDYVFAGLLFGVMGTLLIPATLTKVYATQTSLFYIKYLFSVLIGYYYFYAAYILGRNKRSKFIIILVISFILTLIYIAQTIYDTTITLAFWGNCLFYIFPLMSIFLSLKYEPNVIKELQITSQVKNIKEANRTKENTVNELKVWTTYFLVGRTVSAIFIILMFISILVCKIFSIENNLYTIILPMVATLIIALVFYFTKRNDPNYISYYAFHLSKTSRIMLLVGVILIIIFAILAQTNVILLW